MWRHERHAHNDFQVHPETICDSCGQRAGSHFPTATRRNEFDRCRRDVGETGRPIAPFVKKTEPDSPVDRGNGPGED